MKKIILATVLFGTILISAAAYADRHGRIRIYNYTTNSLTLNVEGYQNMATPSNFDYVEVQPISGTQPGFYQGAFVCGGGTVHGNLCAIGMPNAWCCYLITITDKVTGKQIEILGSYNGSSWTYHQTSYPQGVSVYYADPTHHLIVQWK